MPKVNIYGVSKLDKAIVSLQDYIAKSKEIEKSTKLLAMQIVGIKEVK